MSIGQAWPIRKFANQPLTFEWNRNSRFELNRISKLRRSLLTAVIFVNHSVCRTDHSTELMLLSQFMFLCAVAVTRKPKSSRLLESLLCCFRPTSATVVQQTPPPPPPHFSSLPTSPTTLTTSTTASACYAEDNGFSVPLEVVVSWLFFWH